MGQSDGDGKQEITDNEADEPQVESSPRETPRSARSPRSPRSPRSALKGRSVSPPRSARGQRSSQSPPRSARGGRSQSPGKLVTENSMSFKTATYESKEMKKLMSLHIPEEKFPSTVDDCVYHATDVFPEWVLSNPTWKMVSKVAESDNEISNILQKQVSQRSQDEVSAIIHWLMSVWKIADTMGFKRCGSMFKEFRYKTFEPGENIITEGDRGLVFYIIVSGQTIVQKEGIGIVGHLGKGKGFGEIALTQGKDLRTATVTATTKVEVLSLHKINYDFFVRDIQEAEKRENFQILSACKLFKSWPKAKIEKMCNSCIRKTFEADIAIFKQGDPPEDLYIVVEGGVNIVKELVIVCKNRWPTSINTWGERTKKIHKPIILSTITRGGFFGEVAIIKDVPRSTSAVTTTRTILISLDKREFLHLISYGKATYAHTDEPVSIQKYVDDAIIIETVNHIKGGPKSQVEMGDLQRSKNQVDALGLVKHEKIRKKLPSWRERELHKITKPASPKQEPKEITAESEVQRINHSKEVTEKLKTTTREGLQRAKQEKEAKAKFEEFKHLTETHFQGSLLRNRIEHARKGSAIGFASHSKRQSLAGLDNDHTPNAHHIFEGKVVLRKNSSVQVDMLYNDFYKKLQTNRLQGLTTPDAASFLQDEQLGRRRSARNSIFNHLKGTAAANPPADRYNVDRSSSFLVKPVKEYKFHSDLETTAESEEEGAGPTNTNTRRPFTSPTPLKLPDDRSVESEIELFDHEGNQISPEVIALARRKSMQSNTAGSTLKFRSKSIISYRDAMEG